MRAGNGSHLPDTRGAGSEPGRRRISSCPDEPHGPPARLNALRSPRRGRALGLINWIFDIYQHTQIDKLRDETARARAEAAVRSGTSVDAERLEQAIGELALAVKTVQRMVVEKGLCTPEEFTEKLRQIDLQDGRADGRAPIG